MKNRAEVFRDLWSKDGQYLIRANVCFSPNIDNRQIDVIVGFVLVFFGDPAIKGNAPIFMSSTQAHSDNLEGQLQTAQQLGHDYINTLRKL